MVQTLLNMIPTNPFASLSNGDMLQIIVFALLVGCAITIGGEKTRLIKDICESFNEVMFKIVNFVMFLAPFFIFCLIVPVCATNGPKILLPLLKVILAVLFACAVYGLVFYGAYVKYLGHYSWKKWLKGFAPAMLVAFSTSSSNASLPVSMKCTQENLGVSKEVSSFCLCVGATVNMDGTAIYQGICALFIAQIYGIDLSMAQQATIVFTAVLASIGTAGVPGAGLIMLTMVMQSVGLPMEGLALIAGIDRVLRAAAQLPATAEELRALLSVAGIDLDSVRDPWGHAYYYAFRDSESFTDQVQLYTYTEYNRAAEERKQITPVKQTTRVVEIRSVGADEIRGTYDDFAIATFRRILSLPKPPATAETPPAPAATLNETGAE
jgi:Na+/H+-dicarboxylate symporter